MGDATHKSNYNQIWYWLMGLAAVSIAVSLFHLPGKIAAILIFGAAFWKAGLVAWHFMHLKGEGKMIYLIALIPIVLFIILVLLLIPDFVMKHNAIPPAGTP